jgi:hypothetical protein
MAYYETNRRVIHLSKAKRCLDQADHLCAPPKISPRMDHRRQRYVSHIARGSQ